MRIVDYLDMPEDTIIERLTQDNFMQNKVKFLLLKAAKDDLSAINEMNISEWRKIILKAEILQRDVG